MLLLQAQAFRPPLSSEQVSSGLEPCCLQPGPAQGRSFSLPHLPGPHSACFLGSTHIDTHTHIHRDTYTHTHMPPASSRERDLHAPPQAHSCPPVGLGSRDNTGDHSPFPSFQSSITSPGSSCLGGGLARALQTSTSALLHDAGLTPAAARSSLAALKGLEASAPLFWPQLLSLSVRG